jgi:hypothetical protein
MLATQEAEIRRPAWANSSRDLSQKTLHKNRASGVAQVVECLLSKGEALSSNLSIAQKKVLSEKPIPFNDFLSPWMTCSVYLGHIWCLATFDLHLFAPLSQHPTFSPFFAISNEIIFIGLTFNEVLFSVISFGFSSVFSNSTIGS